MTWAELVAKLPQFSDKQVILASWDEETQSVKYDLVKRVEHWDQSIVLHGEYT